MKWLAFPVHHLLTASSFFTSVGADWVIALLTLFSVLLIPILVFIVRGAIRWTHVEDKLTTLIGSVEKLVSDKDRAHAELRADENRMHAEILEQMRLDREATDRRLRFIEEAWMRQTPIQK